MNDYIPTHSESAKGKVSAVQIVFITEEDLLEEED